MQYREYALRLTAGIDVHRGIIGNVAQDPKNSGRHSPNVARASAAGREVLSGALTWNRTEANILKMVSAGLSLALPLVIAMLLGHPNSGVLAALGALLVAGSGHDGNLRARTSDLGAAALIGTAALGAGHLLSGGRVAGDLAILLLVALVAATGTIRPRVAKAGSQATIFLIIGASLSVGSMPTTQLLAIFASGVVLGGLMGLLTYGIELHLLKRKPGPPAPAQTWREDLAAWTRRMSTWDGWHYTVRLASCMVVAELFAHLVSGRHSYWIMLTVVLVVQRDHHAALLRTTERAVGTSLGVLLGWWMLGPIPPALLVGIVAMIGASRLYLKSANYTSYALVMTPLIVVLGGTGGHPDTGLLTERLVDTLIGCLISLLIGSLPWLRRRDVPTHS